jgi:aromatic-L-amino-acid decarboxylase
MEPRLDSRELGDAAGRAAAWVGGYWERLRARPESLAVLSRAKPGDVLRALPVDPPERGLAGDGGLGEAGWGEIVRDLDEVVMPGLTHWQHPNFYAFFPSNISTPAVVGELLSAGLGVQGMLWATSPACTELETRVLDWLGRAIGLPSDFLSESGGGTGRGGGVIEGTASEAALVALCAARHRARQAIAATGASADEGRWTIYTSTQAHSSILKAAMIAGLARGPEDRSQVRLIDVDSRMRMRADLLAEAMRADIAAGRVPMFVCATVGTTSSTAIDDVGAIADALAAVAASSSLLPWLHVDAAHAGAACICPEFQHWLRGVEHADSMCFNPHKWLLTNFDCDCFWTRDRASVTGAMSITPEYLRNQASDAGEVIDYRDWQVPLGRRFRSLKLWLVMRWYGLEGLRAYIRSHMEMAADFEALVRTDGRFEVVTERTMNLVCFRLSPRRGEAAAETDRRNRELIAKINGSGLAYLTHTTLPVFEGERTAGSMYVLRMAIGAVLTRSEDVRGTWALIQRLANDVA